MIASRSRTYTIRVASPDEGPIIAWFFRGTPYRDLDWDQPLVGTWLIADGADGPAGCIAVNPGIPVGHIDLLSVDPMCSHRQRAIVARDLAYAALESLKQMGSQVAKYYVADHDQSWQNILTKHGGVPLERGTFSLKRL